MLLGIVVDEYIKTVSPVSSAYLVQEYKLDLSPATIRHILAKLEEGGLLTHPHTSAGRIPTQLGYRYYVDHLMNQIQLLEEEKRRIKAEYKANIHALEGLLDKSSQLISHTTHYASIISVDGDQDKVFCHGRSFVVGYPEFQDLKRIQWILQALEEKERILDIINRDLAHRIEFLIGREIDCEGIDQCSIAISRFQKENGPSGRIAVLGPLPMDYRKVVSTLEYFSGLIEELL
jgi:transcriptional regulator of heat shock response